MNLERYFLQKESATLIKRYWFKLASIVLFAVVIGFSTSDGIFVQSVEADTSVLSLVKVKPVQMNNLEFSDSEFVIAGKIYKDRLKAISIWGNPSYGTWRVPSGYTAFVGAMGINDAAQHFAGGRVTDEAKLTIYVDGEKAASFSSKQGDSAIPFSVPVNSGQALKLDFTPYVSIGEPRFSVSSSPTGTDDLSNTSGKDNRATKSPEPEWFKCQTCGMQFDTREGLNAHISSRHTGMSPSASGKFTLDPGGLDRLAENLWKQCENKPAIKDKVANGNVAVATLKPIGTLPNDTPNSVVSDIYTAMIKSGFSLVERGQLDKVLGELKIQDTALIDPTTAAKIGKLSGADLMLLGEITDSDSLVVINARLMETATGRSVAAERVELRKVFTRN